MSGHSSNGCPVMITGIPKVSRIVAGVRTSEGEPSAVSRPSLSIRMRSAYCAARFSQALSLTKSSAATNIRRAKKNRARRQLGQVSFNGFLLPALVFIAAERGQASVQLSLNAGGGARFLVCRLLKSRDDQFCDGVHGQENARVDDGQGQDREETGEAYPESES